MTSLKINVEKALDFISVNEIKLFQKETELHYKSIYDKTGKGNDFLGWVTLPADIPEELISQLEKDAKKLKETSDIVIVTGIGGSYLGAKAVIDALSNNFSQLIDKEERNAPLVLFAGQNIDEDYISELLKVLDEKDYSVIVISKSGTTTEPAIAFRLLKQHLENKYGKDNSKERIVAVTDESKGALKKLADNEGYTTYVIPDDVGGRYSVLSPVGLLPVAVAGLNIRELLKGAHTMQKHLANEKEIMNNPAALYAVVRNILYQKGKTTEILASYNPRLANLTEWWKQLFGESEGKEQKGLFPAGVNFTCDLHSMGQYIQDGLRNLFETVISIEEPAAKVVIPEDPDDLDGLNFLSGKRYSFVNKMAEKGTMLAHVEGGVPNILISLPAINEYTLGELIYFFEMSCALSGYILDVNPFDQPGVEAYKKNMFALLGKPGYEDLAEQLKGL